MCNRTCRVMLAAAGALLLSNEAPAASSQVTIESVSVSPASPGPNALCGLSVTVKNGGTHFATDFRFKVVIDGREVGVYDAETIAENVAPGASTTIALHNFWTPAVPEPKLTVEVSILAGRWADVRKEASTSTTTPIGPIEGLPVSATHAVHMAAR